MCNIIFSQLLKTKMHFTEEMYKFISIVKHYA